MEWRAILDGWYEVSEFGDVRRAAWNKGARPGHILSPYLHKKGYLCVKLQITDEEGLKRYHKYVHTLVAEAFIGKRPQGMTINHKDGNKLYNHYTNLEYITMRQNYDHAVPLHLHCHGEAHPYAVLNEVKVKEIMRRYRAGERQKDLALEFGVNKSTLQALFKGKTWKHVNFEE